MAGASKPRIAFLGECMVELYHRPGDEVGVMRRTVGGDTLNAAVYCRRALGETGAADVHYVTRVGDDAFGLEIPAFIQTKASRRSMSRSPRARRPGSTPSRATTRASGPFPIGARPRPRAAFLPRAATRHWKRSSKRFDGLVYSGISLAILSPEGRERLLALAGRMKVAGRIVAFDGNYRPRLWASREEAAETIARAHAHASLSLPGLDDEQVLYCDPMRPALFGASSRSARPAPS